MLNSINAVNTKSDNRHGFGMAITRRCAQEAIFRDGNAGILDIVKEAVDLGTMIDFHPKGTSSSWNNLRPVDLILLNRKPAVSNFIPNLSFTEKLKAAVEEAKDMEEPCSEKAKILRYTCANPEL